MSANCLIKPLTKYITTVALRLRGGNIKYLGEAQNVQKLSASQVFQH